MDCDVDVRSVGIRVRSETDSWGRRGNQDTSDTVPLSTRRLATATEESHNFQAHWRRRIPNRQLVDKAKCWEPHASCGEGWSGPPLVSRRLA